MHILLFVAGTNIPSNSDYLADRFIEGMKEVPNTSVTKIRLKDVIIEHFDLRFYDASTDQGEGFKAVERQIRESDAVVIASPIWNFSIPAHLKNLIDRMGSFGLDAETHSLGTFKGKPFYLIFTGGSPTPAWTGLQKKTVSHLPTSIRYFGGCVIGSHYEERCTKGRGQFGLVVDQRSQSIKTMRKRGEYFAGVVSTFATTGKLPMRERFIFWLFQIAQKLKKKLGL